MNGSGPAIASTSSAITSGALPDVPADAHVGTSILAPLLSHADKSDSEKDDHEDQDEEVFRESEEARQAREAELARCRERQERRAKKRRNKKNKKKSKRSHRKHRKRSRSTSSSSSSSSDLSDEGEQDAEKAREKRVQTEMEKEKKRLADVERIMAMDERKRPYHSLAANDGHVPTQEEMEAYYRLRANPEDPMSHFKD